MHPRTKGWLLILAGMAIALLGVVAASIATLQMARRYWVLGDTGAPTVGTITRTISEGYDPFSFEPSHKIELTFMAEGRQHRAVHVINTRIWHELSIGETLAMRYIPGRPEINAFHPKWAWINFSQIGQMLAIGFGFALGGVRLIRRYRPPPPPPSRYAGRLNSVRQRA